MAHCVAVFRKKKMYCSATVRQIGDTFVNGANPHICVTKASALSGAKIHAQLCGQCKMDTHSSASSIVNDAQSSLLPTNVPTDSLPQASSLMHKCKLRHKHRPIDPDSLDFEIELTAIPDDFLRADLYVGNKRHLVFYNISFLQLRSGMLTGLSSQCPVVDYSCLYLKW